MEITFAKALGQGIAEEMRKDSDIYIIGENVGKRGNIFKVYDGLYEEFGEKRLRDTPLAEEIIINTAIGSAMKGLRPIAEIMYVDFLTLGIDALINQGAKSWFNSAGKVNVPMVLRAPQGADSGRGSHHTSSFETLFTNIPGLKVVLPSTPYDAKGLIKASIRADDPVVFLEHKLLYYNKGEVPEEEYIIPLGEADVKRKGKDISIITYSKAVLDALEAANQLEKEGINVEVVDLRTLMPLDTETIINSVRKTKRALVLYEAPVYYGAGAEIVTCIQESLFDELEAPVKRLGGKYTYVAYAENLAKAAVPGVKDIMKAVKEVI
jgi:acetoin:2,6-dichlorophenolindophenol oxidoreductase subunit beta